LDQEIREHYLSKLFLHLAMRSAHAVSQPGDNSNANAVAARPCRNHSVASGWLAKFGEIARRATKQ
jgi:hypothetical protein